jgi:Fe-S-cluster containining protein
MQPEGHEDLDGFIKQLPQIVPWDWCSQCRICCRFPKPKGIQSPTWSYREAHWLAEGSEPIRWLRSLGTSPSLHPELQVCPTDCHCPAFSHSTNRCTIYPHRPLDCRLYPFALTRHPSGPTMLAMDLKCPYIQTHVLDEHVLMYVDGLVRYLDRPMGARYIRTNPDIVGAAWPEFLYVAALPSLSDNAHNDSLPPHPALKPLTLRELDRFQAIWQRGRSRLSVHNLSLLWGWKDLMRLWWTKQDGAVCVVVEDRGEFFMPLPPFGRPLDIAVLKSAWSLLEELNHGSGVSRIEGWEEVPNWVTKAGFLKMLNESNTCIAPMRWWH